MSDGVVLNDAEQLRHRRSSRRFIDNASTDNTPNKQDDTLARDSHPVETLIASLLEPSDVEQKVQDYDWYIRYPTTDLSSHALGEEKDLKLYVKAARIAEGEGVDNLLATGMGTDIAIGTVAGGVEDALKANTQFYDSWLKG